MEPETQPTVEKGRYIFWGIYLLVAASLLMLWFVDGAATFTYLFGAWTTTGAIGLWLIEDAVEY